MNSVIGYQVAVTQKSFVNFKTLPEARESFFATALTAGNESACIYSLMSEGGIGAIVAETLVHYEQSPVKYKKLPLIVRATEKELATRKTAARKAA